MTMINGKKIQAVVKIAQELASQQTADDVANMAKLTGQMYENGTLAAEIAVKLIVRVLGIQVDTRNISPVDYLVDVAAQTYRDTYAG